MECPSATDTGTKSFIIVEESGGHKALIKSFPPNDDIYERFTDVDFNLLIHYDQS